MSDSSTKPVIFMSYAGTGATWPLANMVLICRRKDTRGFPGWPLTQTP